MNTLERDAADEKPLFPERGNVAERDITPDRATPAGFAAPAQSGRPLPSYAAATPEELRDPVVARLTSIEELLRELRGIGELQTRELQHQDYSFPRILAGALQGIAAVLFGWCVVEFAFVSSEGYAAIAMRSVFALVLQLMVLTALLWEREKRG